MFKNSNQLKAYFAKQKDKQSFQPTNPFKSSPILKPSSVNLPKLAMPQTQQVNKIQPFLKLREKLKAFKSGGY